MIASAFGFSEPTPISKYGPGTPLSDSGAIPFTRSVDASSANPRGRVSPTMTDWSEPVPVFRTLTLNVNRSPSSASRFDTPLTVSSTPTPSTGACTQSRLPFGPVSTAQFVTDGYAAGPTSTVIIRLSVTVGASTFAPVQVTTLPVAPHCHPVVAVAETNVR